MRIELRDGQWAELRERISHGQDKEIKRAWVRGAADRDLLVDAQTTVVRQFLRAWYVNDLDGQPIAADAADAVERMPDDIVDEIYAKASELYKATTVPNPSTPPSSDGSSPAAE
jgi:hypothetical protein